MELRRTWEDFERTAVNLFGPSAIFDLPRLMKKRHITERQALCYINWTEGMTQVEIAECLGITQSTVNQHLRALERKLPDLFQFPKITRVPPFNPDDRIVCIF